MCVFIVYTLVVFLCLVVLGGVELCLQNMCYAVFLLLFDGFYFVKRRLFL